MIVWRIFKYGSFYVHNDFVKNIKKFGWDFYVVYFAVITVAP